jgi:hypothetical protein
MSMCVSLQHPTNLSLLPKADSYSAFKHDRMFYLV